MKPLAALLGGAAIIAVAVGVASPASAIPNQDNSNLCTNDPAYSRSAAHNSDCSGTMTTIGDVGHDTSAGLPQSFYPLAVPTLTAPTPPTVQNLCAAPSSKPC